MTIYDGSEFGAIDQQAYEDGRPSDEWLRRKMENNVAHLTITEPPVTVMRRGSDVQSDAAGPYYADRAIASAARSVFLAVPVWVTATTKEVKLHLNFVTRASFPRFDPADNLNSVQIGGGVRTPEGRVIGVLADTTHTKTGTYDVEGLTTFTVPLRSQSAQWAIVYLTIQSRYDDANPSEKSQLSSAFGTGSSEVQINLAGTPPLYDPAAQPISLTSKFLDRCVLVEENSTAYADVLAFAGTLASNLFTLTPASRVTPGVGSDMTFMGIQPLTFMQLRSYTIEVVNNYNLRESELLSGLPERGLDSLRHGQSARSIRSKPRMVAAGPTGWMPGLPIRQAIQGRHPQIWESALGVAVGNFGAPPHTLVRTGATESLSDGTVRIVMLVHACVHGGYGVGTVDWRFVATVGNWIGADTTLTQTWTVGAMGTLPVASGPSPGQQGIQGKWIPNIQRAARFGEAYACRDGQFLESEFGDLTLVVMDVAMPATGGSAGLTVNVTAECLGNTQDIAVGDSPQSGQHLTCVAWSVYIVPEEEAE